MNPLRKYWWVPTLFFGILVVIICFNSYSEYQKKQVVLEQKEATRQRQAAEELRKNPPWYLRMTKYDKSGKVIKNLFTVTSGKVIFSSDSKKILSMLTITSQTKRKTFFWQKENKTRGYYALRERNGTVAGWYEFFPNENGDYIGMSGNKIRVWSLILSRTKKSVAPRIELSNLTSYRKATQNYPKTKITKKEVVGVWFYRENSDSNFFLVQEIEFKRGVMPTWIKVNFGGQGVLDFWNFKGVKAGRYGSAQESREDGIWMLEKISESEYKGVETEGNFCKWKNKNNREKNFLYSS